LAAQLSALHSVPDLYLRHAPAPSHAPSLPHEAAPWSAHLPRGSAAPAGTATQRPIDDGSAQLWQEPSQASMQQTPSAQKPLAHSAASVQL
jgi:hypothetical protein